jgi:fermentation-respiration switch protein FrsA (DUF1100 family)
MGLGALLAVMPGLIGGIWGWLGAHPPRLVPSRDTYPDHWGVDFREITLVTPDGLRLAAWYTPSANGVLILVAHGYANARLGEIHALFARHGYGVLAWDFRAHGVSEGSMCTVGYYERIDVETALDFALAQPGMTRIGMWGASMGGIAGLRAAEGRPEIEALVLDSVTASLEESLAIMVRPASLRPTYRWVAERAVGVGVTEIQPVEQITHVADRPMLVIQGGVDDLIPPDSAERLCQAVGGKCDSWVILEAGHVESYQCRPEAYEARVIDFFDTVFQIEPANGR